MGQTLFVIPRSKFTLPFPQPPYKAQSVLALLIVSSSVWQNIPLFFPDEQLLNPINLSLIDKKWVTAAHLTRQPHCLSKFNEVAVATLVFTLFLNASRTGAGLLKQQQWNANTKQTEKVHIGYSVDILYIITIYIFRSPHLLYNLLYLIWNGYNLPVNLR